MGNILSGMLMLLFGMTAQEPAIPVSVRDSVCKTGSYTYDTGNRTITIDGKIFYTSVGERQTPDGRLLYLNLVGDGRAVIGLGYAKKGVDISRGGTYGLTPVPPEKAEAAKKEMVSVDPTPAAVVVCK